MTNTTTPGFTVSDVTMSLEFRGISFPGAPAPRELLTTARVDVPGEGWLMVSRWPGEPGWGVDARFGENGAPHWCNGAGSRVTTVRMLDSDHPVTLELDRLAGELHQLA